MKKLNLWPINFALMVLAGLGLASVATAQTTNHGGEVVKITKVAPATVSVEIAVSSDDSLEAVVNTTLPAPPNENGSVDCPQPPNSTGSPSVLTFVGNDTFTCGPLPEGVNDLWWGTLIGSQSITNGQAFDGGWLCLNSLSLRLMAKKVTTTPLPGNDLVEMTLDPTLTQMFPGQTWYFQFWHRDLGLPNYPVEESTLSNMVTLTVPLPADDDTPISNLMWFENDHGPFAEPSVMDPILEMDHLQVV